MTRSILLASSLLFAIPAAADTPPAPQPTYDVHVEIADGTSTSFTGDLALSGGDCGVLEASSGATHYRVKLCIDQRGGTSLLSLDLDRDVARGKDMLHQKLDTRARVEAGKRLVLGRIGQGADTTEIAATVK
ncbi:MAG TPA: hypothetical protein VL463_05180 [Kofleriaceae bacterium]|nr:hypothetical protein [Kofleriaceae bacterium]